MRKTIIKKLIRDIKDFIRYSDNMYPIGPRGYMQAIALGGFEVMAETNNAVMVVGSSQVNLNQENLTGIIALPVKIKYEMLDVELLNSLIITSYEESQSNTLFKNRIKRKIDNPKVSIYYGIKGYYITRKGIIFNEKSLCFSVYNLRQRKVNHIAEIMLKELDLNELLVKLVQRGDKYLISHPRPKH